MITLEELRAVEVFEGLPEAQLNWVATHAGVLELEAGEALFTEGDPAEHMVVVLSGVLQVMLPRSAQVAPVVTYRAGSVTGVLPFSRMKQYVGRGVAAVPTRLLTLHRDHFQEMVQVSPVLGQRLVAAMSTRVREFARMQQQREKMMALGKLSAGLAHELNNPAAAVRRAAADLEERFARLSSLAACLAGHPRLADRLRAVDALCAKAAQQEQPLRSTLDRSRQEDALADWLDDRGAPESWIMAETFAGAGWTVRDLDGMIEDLPAEAVPDVLAWVEGRLAVQQLLEEVLSASRQISELVASVKAYSHMDQAPERQPTDVHSGLDDTLTMLGHKIKRKHIEVVRTYQPDLPEVMAYGGELNQVWTNLIDNAVDAVEEGGEVRIGTRREGQNVLVEVADNGSGIPPEAQPRIFEPFFTTKEVGEGTGLGLDIAQRIVSQHRGSIAFNSKPGCTVFTVTLPLGMEAAVPT